MEIGKNIGEVYCYNCKNLSKEEKMMCKDTKWCGPLAICHKCFDEYEDELDEIEDRFIKESISKWKINGKQ